MAYKPIALVISLSLSHCRGIIRGIRKYAAEHDDWALVPLDPEANLGPMIRAVKPQGIIAHIYNRSISKMLSALGQPIINVCGIRPQLPHPRVGIDDRLVGEMAAQHFLDRGFRWFACVGHPAHGASITRELGFRSALAKRGFTSDVYQLNPAQIFDPSCTMPMFGKDLKAWLAQLPRPTGIFCAGDTLASQLTESCRQFKISVPEELAILGVDNDDLICELSRPPLSSIVVPSEMVGYQAALSLDQLIMGKSQVLKTPLLLPPIEVVARRSTDLSAISDSDIAAVCRFIREHAHRPLSVQVVLKALGVGRRTIERRFRATLGRGIAEEIRRCHIERAKELLASGRLPLATIAERSGFSTPKQFSTAFKTATGITPSAFRKQAE